MDDAEFFANATEIINDLESELKRVSPGESAGWRALEIGCGTGRLMRVLGRHFREIHGVEPAGFRVDQAFENLRDVANARVHHAENLAGFDEQYFDLIYSLDAPHESLRQIRRVLKNGGLARLRFNGLERTRAEILEFAETEDYQVLALEGSSTRSMWTTWRKQPRGWAQLAQPPSEDGAVRIRRITNAFSSEPLAPCRGRFASIAILAENLPPDAGLNHLRVTIGSSLGSVTYVGAADRSGAQQVRAELPGLEATGLLPVQLHWLERPISPPATLRVIPPPPLVPRVISLPRRAESRSLKMTVEEMGRPDELEVAIDGRPVDGLTCVCTDARPQRFEVSFEVPEEIAPGKHELQVRFGRRRLAPGTLDVLA